MALPRVHTSRYTIDAIEKARAERDRRWYAARAAERAEREAAEKARKEEVS